MRVLGIDIGGSGVKGAPVDTTTGELVDERYRIETPQPSTPDAVTEVVGKVAAHFDWDGRIGVTFPGVVTGGIIRTAANVDHGWIDVDAHDVFTRATGRPSVVLNDADAAGVAEMRFGAGSGQPGVVVLLTFGTGIGSALFVDGTLVPNTEFGHIEIRGKDAERRASAAARERKDLDWPEWSGRVQEYLEHLSALLSPELIIIGGGVSRKADKFLPYLTGLRARIVPATLHNDAGIVGAALTAAAGS